ncbi:MAG: amidohydrolase family protein [Geminicoccaceae bacterium]
MRIADTHNHIVDPLRFPIVPGVGYTPRQADEWGTFEQFDATLGQNAVSNALLVQPSCYGTDNSAMLDAIARSAGRFRGIAVVDIEADDRTLHELADAGIIGVRFNMMQSDRNIFARSGIDRFLARIRELGWFLQCHATAPLWERLAPRLERSGLLLIVDHFGLPAPQEGIDQPGFQALLRAARSAGNWTVKLTAPFRVMRAPSESYPELLPYVEALVDAFGIDNCIWGSDWPYLNGGGGTGTTASWRPSGNGSRARRTRRGSTGRTRRGSSGSPRSGVTGAQAGRAGDADRRERCAAGNRRACLYPGPGAVSLCRRHRLQADARRGRHGRGARQ